MPERLARRSVSRARGDRLTRSRPRRRPRMHRLRSRRTSLGCRFPSPIRLGRRATVQAAGPRSFNENSDVVSPIGRRRPNAGALVTDFTRPPQSRRPSATVGPARRNFAPTVRPGRTAPPPRRIDAPEPQLIGADSRSPSRAAGALPRVCGASTARPRRSSLRALTRQPATSRHRRSSARASRARARPACGLRRARRGALLARAP